MESVETETSLRALSLRPKQTQSTQVGRPDESTPVPVSVEQGSQSSPCTQLFLSDGFFPYTRSVQVDAQATSGTDREGGVEEMT